MTAFTNPTNDELIYSFATKDGDTLTTKSGAKWVWQGNQWCAVTFAPNSPIQNVTATSSAQGVREKLNFATKAATTKNIFVPSLQVTTQANSGTGRSFRVARLSKSEVVALALLYGNDSDTPLVISDAKVASNTVLSSTLNASVSNEWISVGGTTVPARQAANQPSYALSAFGRIYPQESTSNPGHYIALGSAYIAAAQASYFKNSQDLTWMASEPPAGGLHWAMREQDGDLLTSPGSFSSTSAVGQSAILGIVALCKDGSVNIMLAGDSATAGATTWGGNVGESDGAIAIRNLNLAGKICGYINAGWGGQNTTVYCARAAYAYSVLAPDVVAVSVGSPNDGTPSAIGTSLIKLNVMNLTNTVLQGGGDVVFRGWMPTSNRGWAEGVYTPTATGTTAGDIYRRKHNEWAKNLDSRRIPYADGYAALGDGGAPELYVPAYTVDNDHPGPAGRVKAAETVQAALSEVAARYF